MGRKGLAGAADDDRTGTERQVAQVRGLVQRDSRLVAFIGNGMKEGGLTNAWIPMAKAFLEDAHPVNLGSIQCLSVDWAPLLTRTYPMR